MFVFVFAVSVVSDFCSYLPTYTLKTHHCLLLLAPVMVLFLLLLLLLSVFLSIMLLLLPVVVDVFVDCVGSLSSRGGRD